jgi:DNA-binding transcriptional LysR family regulator
VNPGTLANLDLNLLYTLHEVARTGSVTAAARALGRTQPAISTRLRLLESQLGVELFERAGPALRLTPVGGAVVEEVRLLVSQLGAVVDRTRGMDAEPVGTVRIGALPTLCAYLLAPAVYRLTQRHGRARVRMTPGLTATQIDGLRGGEFDALVSVGRVREAGLRVIDIGRIDACAVVLSKSRLARGRLSPKKLRAAPFIAYGRIGDPFFDAVTSFMERADLLGGVSIEVSNIQAIKQLVLEGAGVSILPRYTIVEPALATRAVEGLDVALPLCVVTRPNAERAPIVRELLSELANEVAVRKLR